MIVWIIIYGLIIGSFLTAYTYRTPRDISIAKGRSLCPGCKKKILWYDNIPILSYFLLQGKCRSCQEKISIRYPIIELITAFGFAGIYYLFVLCGKASWLEINNFCYWTNNLGIIGLFFLLIIFSISFAVLIIDLENKIIPDGLNFLGLTLVFVFLLIFSPSQLYIHLLAGFGAGLFLYLIHLITAGKGMGLGDVKLALFIGTLLGWPLVIIWLFAAFLIGAMIGIILLVFRKVSFGKQIPFGPFLIVSFAITMILGNTLINLYLLY